MNIFEAIIVQPLFNVLIFFYNLTGDMGLAIIAMTIVIRALLIPLFNKQLSAQRRMQALQPELKKLQEKHKDDPQKMREEVMAFYRRENFNPASSCLPILLQIPIFIGLFLVFKDAQSADSLRMVYGFVPRPDTLSTTFLGLIDLSKVDVLVLPLLTALLQFVQSKMMLPPPDPSQPAITRQMIYIFPVLMFAVAATLPAAIPLYYATQSSFMVIQQYVIKKRLPLQKAREEAVADWNVANPADPVGQAKAGPKAITAKAGSSANVVIRQRKKK